jgi:Family of unknown function (DUF6481)
LRSTANRAYDHKRLMKTPDFRDRLSAASTAKKAQLERARTIAEDPERLKRIEARSQIIAARDSRIAERERDRREAMAREVAERVAAEAAEAAAREAARKSRGGASGEARRAGTTRSRRGGQTRDYSCRPQSRPQGEEAPRTLEQPLLAIICPRSVLVPISGRWRRTTIWSLVLPSSQVSFRAFLRA